MNISTPPVKNEDVEEAQSAWAASIIEIGASPTWEAAYECAEKAVKNLYLIEDDTLLFCPTKASEQQFRGTLKSAVSYFVGHDHEYEEDQGFALKPWVNIRFENAGIIVKEGIALSMGNYYFTDKEGDEVKAEFTFAHIRDKEGNLKIQLHHSAFPYGK